MAFDQNTRNCLANFVRDARSQLTEEFTRQLQHEYGLDPTSGEVTELERLTALDDSRRETARILRETLRYYLAGNTNPDAKARQETLERIVREQAFTVLNRLSALRMAEARGLIVEAVARGYQSKGYQLYVRLAGSALGETGDAYRSYLFSLFDELALDLPPLFDRFSPQGRLFPRETALLKLLELLNNPEIDQLWAEDETIGWMYQYFNTKEERKAMRDASQAPRNSRELAVRNQFFTPRYVVEFLTDNTLGRIWYEMTRGETALAEACHYLVRYPNEVFLREGDAAPVTESIDENLSHEELLRQPVYIHHRPIKDPRELKMLDPACGSMHFGLYAFDLFEQIYAEAWDLEEKLGENALWRLADLDALHQTYPGRDAFLRDVPRLIIERNIHGVDIDPRAAQIAGLSLWLRAQKSWQAQGVKPQARPQIRRSNIVCAEPMPGDRAQLEEFLGMLKEDRLEALMRQALNMPAGQKVRATRAMADALAHLVRTAWQEMELAGEAGSLLKIEETLRGAIATARKEAEEKAPLFRVLEFGLNEPVKEQYLQVLTGEEQDFWRQAEILVLVALETYAETATIDGSFRRRLFAGDAVQGFAFIELCRKQYDIVLMNPPFGESSVTSRAYITKIYPRSAQEIATCFVERGADLASRQGLVGAITSRFMLANDSLINWRKSEFLGASWNLQIFTDLGYGVLDDAMVEACTYVLGSSLVNERRIFINCLDENDKQGMLSSVVANLLKSKDRNFVVRSLRSFREVPDNIICYWLPETLLRKVLLLENIEEQGSSARVGLQTGDNERFVRTTWEVDINLIGKDKSWSFFAKGGEYEPFYDDIHLLVFWKDNGYLIKNFFDAKGKLSSRPQNLDFYYKEGITYPDRTTSDFSPRIMPSGIIFSSTGFALFPPNRAAILGYLGAAYTRPFKVLIESFVGSGDSSVSGSAARHYRPGILNLLPNLLPNPDEDIQNTILESIRTRIKFFDFDETTRYFSAFAKIGSISAIHLQAMAFYVDYVRNVAKLIEKNYVIEQSVIQKLGIDENDDMFDDLYAPHPITYPPTTKAEKDEIFNALNLSEDILVSRLASVEGAGRSVVKKSYFSDRKIELVCRIYKIHPGALLKLISENNFVPTEYKKLFGENIISFVVGVIWGRWNVLYATGEKAAPELPDPFSPLPACPHGMLQNSHGLPAAPQDVPAGYPLRITWSGILCDDEGELENIETRARETLYVIWGERAEAIEAEACQVLGVRSLREYFQKPGLFFAEHLARYSKSRRQAPIYWPLSTPSGSYTLWLYFHRLSDQTLFTCVNDFIEPKLKQVGEEAKPLRLMKVRSVQDERELERLTDFERELKDFRDELLRIAKIWKPDLSDGVQISAAPLWKLFQHKPWQKKLHETWEALESGEYDWAHLAYVIWPERVREKCKTDKSLAITHRLEHLYVETAPQVVKKKKGKITQDDDASFLFNDI